MEKDKIHRWRTLLMLRLPTVRTRLAQATAPALEELICAYEVAQAAASPGFHIMLNKPSQLCGTRKRKHRH